MLGTILLQRSRKAVTFQCLSCTMPDTIVLSARCPVYQTERQQDPQLRKVVSRHPPVHHPFMVCLSLPTIQSSKNLHLYLNRFHPSDGPKIISLMFKISLLQLNSATSYLEKWSFNCLPFTHKLYEMSQGCTRLLTQSDRHTSGDIDERHFHILQSLFF